MEQIEITDPAVKRMMGMAGVKSMNKKSYQKIKDIIDEELKDILSASVEIMKHNKVKTLNAEHVKIGVQYVYGDKILNSEKVKKDSIKK